MKVITFSSNLNKSANPRMNIMAVDFVIVYLQNGQCYWQMKLEKCQGLHKSWNCNTCWL